MSRLSRTCRDWYQLLELAAAFGVLLVDQDDLYDPGEHNDRSCWGLRGS
jgi:DNA invertase Pin-like site-specific DNA recombinase